MSPFSSTVTDSGTVTWASRWTSGYVMPGNGMPAKSRTRLLRAVAAHEVAGGHPILPVRAAHVRGHRGVVLAQPDHLVSAADLGAELAGELVEQALELRLWERQRLHRGIGQLGEVHMHAAEREPGSRAGSGAGCFESFEQASVAQHLQDLPAETAGLRDVSGLRLPLEHQRPHSGQAQLTGQHQAGRAGAHDDHVGVHHRPLPAPSVVACSRSPSTSISPPPVSVGLTSNRPFCSTVPA